jgi:transposase-like protein
VEGILEGEMEHHIGYEKHDKSPKQAANRRNGCSKKRVTSGDDTLDLNIPMIL